MDILHLRIMVRKSIFLGGKCDGLSVQELLNLNEQSYIAYQYFNYDKVSFSSDILEEISIVDNLVIKKPGKSKKLFSRWQNYFYGNLTDLERIKRYSIRWKTRRNKLKRFNKVTSVSKTSYLQKQRYGQQTFTGGIK